MKAVLEFNLPEEETEFQTASHAAELLMGLHEIKRILRDRLKYGIDVSEDGHKELTHIQEAILEITQDLPVDLRV